MLPEHTPDKEEKIIRFIFGFVAGAILAAISCWGLGLNLELFLLVIVVASLACALAAVRYGDRFWHGFVGNFWWW